MEPSAEKTRDRPAHGQKPRGGLGWGARVLGATIAALIAVVFVDAASAAILRFPATADARVEWANPDTNFGGSSYLRVDGSVDPAVRTYLRFDVTGVTGSVTAATLRLYATSATLDGPAVFASGTDWAEEGITWTTRPWRSTTPTDDSGLVVPGAWIDLDVTKLVRGDGQHGFVLLGTSSDGVNFGSREAGWSPELILSVSGWPANPFPLGSVYNPGHPIPGDVAVDPNSANIVDYLVSTTTGGWKFVCCNWAQAIQEASPGDPIYQVVDDGYHGSGNINRFGGVPIKRGTLWDPSGDGHLTILDYVNRREYSFWQANYDVLTDTWSATCSQATTFDELNIAGNYCGANTANMPGSAGIVTPEELQAGVINHPLVFAAAVIRGRTRSTYVCPAAGGWGGTDEPNAPVSGMWFQMDPTLDVNALPIPSWQKTIVRALQEYGAYIRDQSANDTTFFGENPLNRPTVPSWGSLGINGNTVLSSAIPWSRMRVLAPPC